MAFNRPAFLLVLFVGVVSAVEDFCPHEGPICRNDSTVSLCVGTPDGYQQIDVETCSPGFHCAYTTKQCVADTFKCHQPGVFPDPYDCHKYYVCGDNPENLDEYDGVEDFCIRYYHFDLVSGQCQIHSPPGECEEGPQPVPQCTEFLQTGVLESNNNYYYVCAKASSGDLYPKVYKCGEKQYYDPSRKVCVQEI